MIQVSDVSYSAGRKILLQNVDLRIKPGEMLAIIGANGAGKSTLMKLLCKELEADKGNILINGRNISAYKQNEMAKIRAVLAQHNTISMAFKVHELVLMGRYPHFESRPSSIDIEIVKQVMDETGISHLSARDYNTLSGGEQQRVQLARVIAQVYDVPNGYLFLDEPTNGLDILYQQQILFTARQMADKGYCVVCILHDINSASRYADNILILKDGKTIDFGPPLKVISCETIHEAFNIHVRLMECEGFECPMIIPGANEIYKN